jgi:ubiquinone/menaquinone biosynthesis C-methylase UbiE
MTVDGAIERTARYADDWNRYSRQWESQYGAQYEWLGDEWNDDSTPDRRRDAFFFQAHAERWITPATTALEIGPGGGKWTVRLARKVERLVVLDVAEEMLERTRSRCERLGLTNVEYVLGNGRDFQPIADESVDFVFSYDVFVHVALEDAWPYGHEIVRVLRPGGLGACHYAIGSTPEAWDHIEQHNDWYRGGQHTLGQYFYFSPEMLRRMAERCGLRVVEQHVVGVCCTCVVEKPATSPVPRLEQLLARLISRDADDDRVRADVALRLQALVTELARGVDTIVGEAQREPDFYKRLRFAAAIRRLWRGI